MRASRSPPDNRRNAASGSTVEDGTGPTTVARSLARGCHSSDRDVEPARRRAGFECGTSARLATRACPAVRSSPSWRRSPWSACDDDGGGDTEAFCDDVADNVEALRVAPATEDEVEDLIDLWRDVGGDAPLAIEAEWDTHADNLETGMDERRSAGGRGERVRRRASTVAIADVAARELRHRLRSRHDDRPRHAGDDHDRARRDDHHDDGLIRVLRATSRAGKHSDGR